MSYPYPKRQACLLCGNKKPGSSILVWEKDKLYGQVCSSHTLREVFWYQKGKRRLHVRLTRIINE